MATINEKFNKFMEENQDLPFEEFIDKAERFPHDIYREHSSRDMMNFCEHKDNAQKFSWLFRILIKEYIHAGGSVDAKQFERVFDIAERIDH